MVVDSGVVDARPPTITCVPAYDRGCSYAHFRCASEPATANTTAATASSSVSVHTVMSRTLKSPSAAAAWLPPASRERPGLDEWIHRPDRVGNVHCRRWFAHAQGRQRPAGGAEAADGVLLADGQPEFERLLAEPCCLLGPAGQLGIRGPPGQRSPPATRMTQLAGQAI